MEVFPKTLCPLSLPTYSHPPYLCISQHLGVVRQPAHKLCGVAGQLLINTPAQEGFGHMLDYNSCFKLR